MTNLTKINGKNTYCGPAVISAITGCTTDDAEKLIQDITKSSKPVKGVYTSDLCEAFHRLGYKTTYYTHLNHTGSLFYILSVLSDGMYVLTVPGHFICIEVVGKQRFVCDSFRRTPINAAISARGSQRVGYVVKVEKSENPIELKSDRGSLYTND